MPNKPLLDNITIVLVSTKTPANIGSIARCMMNMGLSHLVLVDPPDDKNSDAKKLAAGADSVLNSARICSSLSEAIDGHGLVIGTSRQMSRRRKNVSSPRQMAEQVVPLLARNRVALVFGNEVNGLENDALALCHEIVAIPSSDAFPSLNLSHAVMVFAYGLFTASTSSAQDSAVELARVEELEGYYTHLQEVLRAANFIDQKNEELMMFSLRQMFGRARLTERDVKILRGILTAVAKKDGHRK